MSSDRNGYQGLGGDVSLVIGFGLLLVLAGGFWLEALAPASVRWSPFSPHGSPAAAVTVVDRRSPSLAPSASLAAPAATLPPRAAPSREPFAMDIFVPGSFVSQIDKEHCMSAAMQNMLNLVLPTIDLTAATQRRIAAVALPLSTDTIGGGEGPAGWAAGLGKLGAGQYEVRVYATRAAALRDGVLALRSTGRPVGILAWWGAHSWVLTGFEADADPAAFDRFTVSGYRIVDPWYPRTSTIWGKASPPDSLRSPAEMVHNLPAWTRPEGHYPDRDGRWLMVIPIGPTARPSEVSLAS